MRDGVLYYNKGTGCLIRLVVSIYSLRKHYNGPITIASYGEESRGPCMEICKYFQIEFRDVKLDPLVPKGRNSVFLETCRANEYTPYENITVWLDSDTLIKGPIDDLFNLCEKNGLVVTNFTNWRSNGSTIKRRIKRWEKLYPDLIDDAIQYGPALNCGIFSWKKDHPFMADWYHFCLPARKTFIPNEVGQQILMSLKDKDGSPKYKHTILDGRYNCSGRYGDIKKAHIIHLHGRKHLPNRSKAGSLWFKEYNEALSKNVANLQLWTPGEDKRLKQYLDDLKAQKSRVYITSSQISGEDITLVTGVTPDYLEKLKTTLPTWKFKPRFNQSPLIIFTHGFSEDADFSWVAKYRSDFHIIPWEFPLGESVREIMLSSFVFGAAHYVKTSHWVKIDCDAYFTDTRDLFSTKSFSREIVGCKWGYTKPGKWIAELDDWANGIGYPGSPYLQGNRNNAIRQKRFGHPRIASWICLHKSSFVREAAQLAIDHSGGRLPVPSHDTYLWYLAERNPHYSYARIRFKNMGATNNTRLSKIKADLERRSLAQDS